MGKRYEGMGYERFEWMARKILRAFDGFGRVDRSEGVEE